MTNGRDSGPSLGYQERKVAASPSREMGAGDLATVIVKVSTTGRKSFFARIVEPRKKGTKRKDQYVRIAYPTERTDSQEVESEHYTLSDVQLREIIENAANRIGNEIDRLMITYSLDRIRSKSDEIVGANGIALDETRSSLEESVRKLEEFVARPTDTVDRAAELNRRLRQWAQELEETSSG